MILADFKLRPLQGSKFYTRIRIFDTQRNMERQAVADGSMTGEAQACHAGIERHELDAANNGAHFSQRIGDVYLYLSPSIRRDAIHELTHAAVHYVRMIRNGDLAEPNNGEYASEAEELLCRSMEFYIPQFCLELARLLRKRNFEPGARASAYGT